MNELMDDVEIYASGLCYLSVCTTLTDADEIERRVNSQQPSGIESHWRITGEPFKTGDPNPSPCPDRQGHQHFLLSC